MNRKISRAERREATIFHNEDEQENNVPANFEDAIKAAGLGKFNLILLGMLIPISFTQISEQTSLSYVVPIAQCDLNISLEQKGILVSIPYVGMVLSAFLWGYICDTYGRRKLIIYGYLANSICYFLSALSQNYMMLLITKLISGFVFTGPFSAITSYLSEFHSTENRSRVHLIRGIASGIAIIILPMIAWVILPNAYTISVTNDFKLRSWNFFLMICGVPTFITGITFIFLPESPKFLMASGKTTEAIEVFKVIYNKNTGRRSSTFPIKILVEERPSDSSKTTSTISLTEKLRRGFLTLKPLFQRPHVVRLIHVCFNAMSLAIASFAVKMWYPQILQALNDLSQTDENNGVHICNILESLTVKSNSSNDVCIVNLDNSSVYINSSIQGAIQLLAFIIAGFVVHLTGTKYLVVALASLAALCPIILYFTPNGTVIVTLFPMILAFSEICTNVLTTITMELFPTAFRSTALNMHQMSTRIGAASGNVCIPYLLKSGCTSTLTFITFSISVCAGLTSLVPNADNLPLQ